MTSIFIIAGEASGDQHGAALARALKQLEPDIKLTGLGGDKMRAAGVELLQGIEHLDVVGLPSPSQLLATFNSLRKVSDHLKSLSVDAVVHIDLPGFNLRLAPVAKSAGHRVIYYIAPQLWAWNRKRIEKIKKFVDLVLVILPFEPEIYHGAGIRCTFVGHPLMDELADSYDRDELRKELNIAPDARVVGLLPGSRRREVNALLPVMLEAASQIVSTAPPGGDIHFVLGKAASIPSALLEKFLLKSRIPVQIISDRPYDVMAISDAMWVASGTATLQTALVGTPMTIVYRGGWMSALFVRAVIRVKWFGLANLVAGRVVARELLQDDCTPQKLAFEVKRLLDDPEAPARSAAVAKELRQRLGKKNVSVRAARAILDECGAGRMQTRSSE